MSTETPETRTDPAPAQIDVTALTVEELQALRDEIAAELNHRSLDVDLEDAESANLVNGQYVKWRALSAHANLKAVKPWILKVTGTHEEYTVAGDWLDKQRIDGKYHMDISDVAPGDIIRVSGASHSNKKHRYYRVIAITDNTLYYDPKYGLDEADVFEEVG